MNDDLMTLPSMTKDAARRLRTFGVTTRTALHDQIAYQPGVIAYAGDVSMKRVEMWLCELEQDTKVTDHSAAVTANPNVETCATAIATFLVEEGALSIGDQIFAIRQQYALAWRATLVRAGFDDCAGMSVSDIAAGVDLALSRLLDAAQQEYADAQSNVAPRNSQLATHPEAQP